MAWALASMVQPASAAPLEVFVSILPQKYFVERVGGDALQVSVMVRVVFVQAQFGSSAALAVARAIGGEVVSIDPLAEDFLANMRAVAQALAKAMR